MRSLDWIEEVRGRTWLAPNEGGKVEVEVEAEDEEGGVEEVDVEVDE